MAHDMDCYNPQETSLTFIATIKALCDILVTDIGLDYTSSSVQEALRDLYFAHGFSELSSHVLMARADVLLQRLAE